VLVLGGIFVGGFAAAWTFLFPLPAHSLGAWGPGATASYLVGVLVVGVGFLLLYLDTGRAILASYGSLGKALGWPQAFRGSQADPPPPTVVASTVVTLINIPAIAVGAVILTMSLVNATPRFRVNALVAKNLIFFFGHVFINSTIYMAVIGVYEILPAFTGRPWKSSKPFLLAWTATMLMVLAGLPASPVHGLRESDVGERPRTDPVVHEQSARAGGDGGGDARQRLSLGHEVERDDVPAVRLHHGMERRGRPGRGRRHHRHQSRHAQHALGSGALHIYLVLGVVSMLFGFMYFLGLSTGSSDSALDRASVWLYLVGGLGFGVSFLAAGA
jgi:cytochrome c oxidase subunit 1